MSKNKPPVVEIDAEGNYVTYNIHKKNDDDYQFNKAIDKYFTDVSVNKLIYETRLDQKRFQ